MMMYGIGFSFSGMIHIAAKQPLITATLGAVLVGAWLAPLPTAPLSIVTPVVMESAVAPLIMEPKPFAEEPRSLIASFPTTHRKVNPKMHWVHQGATALSRKIDNSGGAILIK